MARRYKMTDRNCDRDKLLTDAEIDANRGKISSGWGHPLATGDVYQYTGSETVRLHHHETGTTREPFGYTEF
jgi:hypothetical protein